MSAPVDRVELAMPHALAMVTAVRTGPDEVGRILELADLPALAVALAALVPDDQTINNLLRWYHPHLPAAPAPAPATTAARERSALAVRVLQPCGTHAAYARHKTRREPACDACTVAERAYQNARPRDRRKAA